MAVDRHRLTPRKVPRQRRAELTRQRILDAATIVFGRYGYANTSTTLIAEWSDLSVGSLYQYFPSKDAILLELATQHLAAGEAADALQSLHDSSHTLIEVVRALVRSSIDNHRADPNFLRVLLSQTPRSAELITQVEQIEARREANLVEVLREIDEVAITDRRFAAHLVVATLEMVVHYLLAGSTPIDTARLESELVEMLYRYLSGKPTPD